MAATGVVLVTLLAAALQPYLPLLVVLFVLASIIQALFRRG
jgi:hypothetical protein